MENFEKQREVIIKALEARGATRPCPRCGSERFSIVDGYSIHFIQDQLGSVRIGGPNVPTVVVACLKCGWIAEHALGALGLLPDGQIPRQEDKR